MFNNQALFFSNQSNKIRVKTHFTGYARNTLSELHSPPPALLSKMKTRDTNCRRGSSRFVTLKSMMNISLKTEKTPIDFTTKEDEVWVRAGNILVKGKRAKNAREFKIGKKNDLKTLIEMFYTILFYPANVSNSWAISHPDAPEIKELGLPPDLLNFISQLEKIKNVDNLPLNLIFENPVLFDIKDRKAYMDKLVAKLASSNI